MDKASIDKAGRIARRIFADDDDEYLEDVESNHDIEISCYYDTDLGQTWFDDSFTLLGNDGSESIYGYEWSSFDEKTKKSDKLYAEDIFEISDYDQLAETFGDDYNYESYLNDMDADDVAKEIMKHCTPEQVSDICLEDIKDAADLAEWIVDNKDEYDGKTDGWEYEWVVELFPDEVYDSVVEWAKKQVGLPSEESIYRNFSEDCGLAMKDGYDYEYVRVYSKGESCYVLYKTADVSDTSIFKDMIYSSPISCRIEVDGEEYYVDSEMNSSYDYDRNEVITIMKRLMGDKWDDEIESYLEENLPEYPEVN